MGHQRSITGPCLQRPDSARRNRPVDAAEQNAEVTDELSLRQYMAPAEVSPSLRAELIDCWVEVSNAGGAVGFPFPPVDPTEVAAAVDDLLSSQHPGTRRLLTAHADGRLAGWVSITRVDSPLVGHWATVQRLQTRLDDRRKGVATALMTRLPALARREMGVEHLWLAVRAGMGLEAFYQRLGWQTAGVHPAALRLGPGDDRDEVFMVLTDLGADEP